MARSRASIMPALSTPSAALPMLLSGNVHAVFAVHVDPEMSKRWIVESEFAVTRPDAVFGVAVVMNAVFASVKAMPTMSVVTPEATCRSRAMFVAKL